MRQDEINVDIDRGKKRGRLSIQVMRYFFVLYRFLIFLLSYCYSRYHICICYTVIGDNVDVVEVVIIVIVDVDSADGFQVSIKCYS